MRPMVKGYVGARKVITPPAKAGNAPTIAVQNAVTVARMRAMK